MVFKHEHNLATARPGGDPGRAKDPVQAGTGVGDEMKGGETGSRYS